MPIKIRPLGGRVGGVLALRIPANPGTTAEKMALKPLLLGIALQGYKSEEHRCSTL